MITKSHCVSRHLVLHKHISELLCFDNLPWSYSRSQQMNSNGACSKVELVDNVGNCKILYGLLWGWTHCFMTSSPGTLDTEYSKRKMVPLLSRIQLSCLGKSELLLTPSPRIFSAVEYLESFLNIALAVEKLWAGRNWNTGPCFPFSVQAQEL